MPAASETPFSDSGLPNPEGALASGAGAPDSDGSDCSWVSGVMLYEQLRRLARNYVRREPSECTLGATALVHEVYLKLSGSAFPEVRDDGHFMALCARLMRQILVTHARRRKVRRVASGHGGELLDRVVDGFEARSGSLVALDAALDRLHALDPRKAAVVELRFFAGFSDDVAADLLGVSTRTFRREWSVARGWLRTEVDQ